MIVDAVRERGSAGDDLEGEGEGDPGGLVTDAMTRDDWERTRND